MRAVAGRGAASPALRMAYRGERCEIYLTTRMEMHDVSMSAKR
ncbi:hypothetical protein XCR_2536 [Xanthomonas campestris pv. raphani 756C]|nr:hypothetical protein XCR_2536 [Xanthomonas campestris pv. raphani 756C]